jgi:uncharacterized protein (DUF1697 family)
MTKERVFLFLRAVNLGRRNKVGMDRLIKGVSAAGLGEARYLLQSGNLIFPEARMPVSELRMAIEELIRDDFGVETVVIVRRPAELTQLLARVPFGVPEGGSIQISMWNDAHDEAGYESLQAGDYGEDRLHLLEREAVMRFSSNARASRLGNALIERRLRVPATARNIRTLERLLDLSRQAEQEEPHATKRE